MNYTNVEQSRKLAKILPVDSADGYWFKGFPCQPYMVYTQGTVNIGEQIPCWSVKALLDELPADIIKDGRTYRLKFEKFHHKEEGWTKHLVYYGDINDKKKDKRLVFFENTNLIDCLYNMVLWYYENKNNLCVQN